MAQSKKVDKPFKANAVEIETRINAVFTMLLNGGSRRHILQYATKQEWGVQARQIDEYIARAKRLFVTAAAPVRDEEMGKAIERLNMLFSENMRIQDYKAALGVQMELNRLLNLYKPIEISVDGKLQHEVIAGAKAKLESLLASINAESDPSEAAE